MGFPGTLSASGGFLMVKAWYTRYGPPTIIGESWIPFGTMGIKWYKLITPSFGNRTNAT